MFPSGSVSGEQFSLTPTTATFAGNVSLADNKRVTFGAGNDLSISHDATDSYITNTNGCLLYTSPSPRDRTRSRMPSSA